MDGGPHFAKASKGKLWTVGRGELPGSLTTEGLVGFVGEFEQEVTNRLRPNGYEGQEGTKVGTAGLCWGRGNHGPYFAARATKGKQHGRHGKGTL